MYGTEKYILVRLRNVLTDVIELAAMNVSDVVSDNVT